MDASHKKNKTFFLVFFSKMHSSWQNHAGVPEFCVMTIMKFWLSEVEFIWFLFLNDHLQRIFGNLWNLLIGATKNRVFSIFSPVLIQEKIFMEMIFNPINHASVDHQNKLCYCWTQTLWNAKIPPKRKYFEKKDCFTQDLNLEQ